MDAHLRKLRVALLALLGLGLAACGGGMDDLDSYINEIKAKPGGRIDPLPEITPYEVFTYVADAEGVRSPFVPDSPQIAATNTLSREIDPERPKEFLENFPLDSLSMVGTLNFGEDTYGLIQTPDRLIHRVLPGNYMGQNDGRITEISESEVVLVEIISDGIGGYIERDAAVGLTD